MSMTSNVFPRESRVSTLALAATFSALLVASMSTLFVVSSFEPGFWRDATLNQLFASNRGAAVGVVLAQPVVWMVRVGIVALLLQMMLLLLGQRVSLGAVFRLALIASGAQLLQQTLMLLPVFEYRDMTHAALVPGTLGAAIPSLGLDRIWGGGIRQISLYEAAWCVLVYVGLRQWVDGRMAMTVTGLAWVITALVAWFFSLAPAALSAAP